MPIGSGHPRANRSRAAAARTGPRRQDRPSERPRAERALVLGAAGHIGNAIARELLARGYEVTAVGRRAVPPGNLEGLTLRYAPCDLDSPGDLDGLVAGHSMVVDAAAPYPSLMARTRESAAASLEGARRRTRRLLEAAARAQARLAYISSFTTLPRRDTGGAGVILRELIRRSHDYFALKQEIESLVLEAAGRGLRASVVNPTLCIGPWDLKPRELCFIPRLLGGEAPATVAHLVNVIDVREVAAAVVSSVEAERWGAPIPLSGHNLSVEALYNWICEIGGTAPPRLVAPLALGVIAAYVTEVGLGAFGIAPPLPALAPMLTMMHEPMDPGPVQRELGVAPRPLSATLRDAIAWYRSIGYC